MLEFLVDNIFVVFGGKVFQQIVGIPKGTNCAPLLADIPYNGYFLRLEIFAILAQKSSILIFAFLIFAIPFNCKKWLLDHHFHTWI